MVGETGLREGEVGSRGGKGSEEEEEEEEEASSDSDSEEGRKTASTLE